MVFYDVINVARSVKEFDGQHVLNNFVEQVSRGRVNCLCVFGAFL